VAGKLDAIGLNYAFVGGSILGLLLDDASLSPVRPTDDVDVIVEVLTARRYSQTEARLRAAGLVHDDRPGAPLCRWTLSGITVDIMPTDGGFLGLNATWFAEALALAIPRTIGGRTIRVVAPVAFLATKLAAFADRGRGDLYGSHDLEDLIAVLDGRSAIVSEIAVAPVPLRRYIVISLGSICRSSAFQEALPSFLPPDAASQRRLPLLRNKLKAIAELG
jgi:hypothetical protein